MKKKRYDSIFEIDTEKVLTFKLTQDSTSMAFAAYLKKEYNGLSLSPEQQSDVFMNSLIVHII